MEDLEQSKGKKRKMTHAEAYTLLWSSSPLTEEKKSKMYTLEFYEALFPPLPPLPKFTRSHRKVRSPLKKTTPPPSPTKMEKGSCSTKLIFQDSQEIEDPDDCMFEWLDKIEPTPPLVVEDTPDP